MEKEKTFEQIQKSINQEYGEGTAFVFGENEVLPNVDTISTSSFGLDDACGQGVPRGRITEFFGPPGCGKTTVSLHCIAEAQKQGLKAAFIDMEHALDINYAKALGIDLSKMLIVQPDYAEAALKIIEDLVRNEEFGIVVVDSVAAMTPKAEIEGDFGDANMGLMARLMSQAMRKLTSIVHKQNVALIFINQTRMKIGIVFGNPETTTGGNALKFYATLRVSFKQKSKKDTDGSITSCDVEAYVVKNKIVPPFKKAFFPIVFGKGIDRIGEIFDTAVKYEIIEKSGAWFNYKKDRIGHGREKALASLLTKNCEKMLEQILNEIKTHNESSQEGE